MDVTFRCRCGSVRGVVREVSPSTVNHGICYCHDCRAFAHWLERDDLLVTAGGSPIVQIARARLWIDVGLDRVRLLRLSEKGLHRYYAACCRSPVGNTVPSLPFFGIVRSSLDAPADALGPAMAIARASALGTPPPAERGDVLGLLHVARLMAGWAIRGLGRPTPLDQTIPSQVLTSVERETLRAHPQA